MTTNKSVTVKICIEDGNIKNSTEFAMDNVSELERIVILQSVFKSLNVESDLKSLVDDYVRLGKAYQGFFDMIESEEPKDNPKGNKIKKKKKKEVTKPASDDGLINKLVRVTSLVDSDSPSSQTNEQSDDLHVVDKNIEPPDDRPEHFKTGIKITPSGNFYQCRLHCTRCKYKKTFYIKPTDVTVYCKFCNQVHAVKQAKKEKLQNDLKNI